jgi:hypothetical protein
MSPTQAREVIEAAAERIADWKSRLKINTGRGVETWDNVTGQMVSVSVPQEMMVKEPLVLQSVLWANTRRVTTITAGIDEPAETIDEASGWYGVSYLNTLTAGQSVPPRTSDQYKYPDALQPVVGFPEGYFSPTYDPVIALAPDTVSLDRVTDPQEEITAGAIAGVTSTGRIIASTLSTELSIRGYTSDYLQDRARRGLQAEFDKGVSIGNYDLVLRKQDTTAGPIIGEGEDAYYAPTTVLASSTHRIGFAPSSFIFYSTLTSVFGSPGIIGVMSYRKV